MHIINKVPLTARGGGVKALADFSATKNESFFLHVSRYFKFMLYY